MEFVVNVDVKLIYKSVAQKPAVAVTPVPTLIYEMVHIFVVRLLELSDSSALSSHMNHLISYA